MIIQVDYCHHFSFIKAYSSSSKTNDKKDGEKNESKIY
jgi:hypothetical protein